MNSISRFTNKASIFILTIFLLSGSLSAQTITIGSGTLNQRQPFGYYYGYERSASIYTATEATLFGTISHLAWNVATAQPTGVPTKIYLKTTTAATVTAAPWATLTAGAVLVYDASEQFTTTGWHTIDITDFSYTADNLLVLCETNYTGIGTSPYAYFYYTAATNQHAYLATDNSPSTGNATVNSNRPDIQITFIPATPCTLPSNGPADLVLTPASTNISGTFTPVMDADNYLIIYSTSSPLSQTPVDGTVYTPGAALGNGTVLGYTSLNSFNLTGLLPSTQYYFYIFSCNKNCTGGPLYVWNKPLIGFTSTLITDPLAFTASGVDGSSVGFSATPDASDNDIMIAWNLSGTFGIPVGLYNPGDTIAGGGIVYYNGPASGLVNQTGLNPITIYHYKAFSTNGTEYSGGITDTAKTKCGTVMAYPFTEGFESPAWPPDCWTVTTVSGTAGIWSGVTNGTSPTCTPYGGSTSMAKFNSFTSSDGSETRLESPYLDMTGLTVPNLLFYMYHDDGYSTYLEEGIYVQVSIDGTTWTTLGPLYQRVSTSNAWAEHTVDLSAYVGQTIKIGFLAHSQYGNNIFLDNINLYDNTTAPLCATLISPADSSVNVNLNAAITWNSSTGASSYDLYFGTNPNPPLLQNQATTSYQPSPALDADTTYYWKVVPKNANGEPTGCAVWSFTTGSTLEYCFSGLGGGSCPGDITNVAIPGTTLDNSDHTACSTANSSISIQFNQTGSYTGEIVSGSTYMLNVTSNASSIISMWIDYNYNGIYEASEWNQVTTASTANTPATVNFTVPGNAHIGTTGMRIRTRSTGNPNGATDACTNFASGITEDYRVTIVFPQTPVALFSADLLNPIIDQVVTLTDTSDNFPTSWEWTISPNTFSFVNGTDFTSQNPQVQFSATGLYAIKLKASNIIGADSLMKQDYIDVTFPAFAPVADFTASAVSTFTNTTDTLTDLSINTPTAWAWTVSPATFIFTDGTTASSQNPHVQFTAAGVYTIQLIAANAAGSDTVIKTDYVTVALTYCNSGATSTLDEEILNVTFGSLNNTSTCSTTGGAGSILNQYSDFTGITAPGIMQNSSVPFSVQIGTCGGNYTNGCAIWIDFNQDGSFSDTVEKVYFSPATTSGPHVESGNIFIPLTTLTGLTRMRVVVSESSVPVDPCSSYTWGETEDYTVDIFAPQAPVAMFSADLLNPIIDQVVTLTDTSDNFPTSWEWTISPNTFSFVNGTDYTSQNSQVQFSATGLYAIKLKASNITGADSLTKPDYIDVALPTTPPVAYFYADDTTVTTIQTVSLIDTSIQVPTAWNWVITPGTYSFINGTNASTQNPQVIFNAAGFYTVQLTAGNYAGSDTILKTDYIEVTEQYNMTDSVIYTCDALFYDYGGLTGTYLDSMDDTLVVYPATPGAKISVTFSSFNLEAVNWDNLNIYDGNSTSATLIGTYGGTTIPPIATSTATDGSLTFVFHSDGSVTNPGWEAQFACILPPLPEAGFYADDTTPIVEQVVAITDTSLNFPTSWSWNITPTTYTYVSGTSATSQNPVVTFQDAGLYTVSLIATNAVGNDTLIKTDYINVTIPSAPPTAYFLANDTTPVTSQVVMLVDTSANTPTAWQWSISPATFNYLNGTNATTQNPEVQFTSQGLYTVTLIASNAAGPDTLEKVDYINVASAINMTSDTITTCSTILFDSGGQGGDYSNNEQSVLVILPETPGNAVQLSFSSFNLQLGWDFLYVYSGTDTTGALIGSFTGTTVPPQLFSTTSDGALTLKFVSDGSSVASGWDAYLNCILPPAKNITWSDTIFNEAVANNGTISTVSTLTLVNEYFTTTGTFTEGIHFTSGNVPAGLTVVITAVDNTTASVTLSGTAISHSSSDNISNLSITFTDAAFSGNDAASVNGSSLNNMEIHFYDPLVVPGIVFSEIMYDSPDAGLDSLEYIELYNYSTGNVDLNNYTFSGITYTIPNGTTMPAGSYLVVAKNATAIFNNFGINALQWNAGVTNTLNNNGEMLKLITFWGATVDSVQYSTASPWPAANGNGNSIVLCDPGTNHMLPASWQLTTSVTTHMINGVQLNGSPGTNDNTCLVTSDKYSEKPSVKVYPNPVDETVNIEVSGETSKIKIEIFSPDGKVALRQEYNNVSGFSGNVNISKLSPGIYTLRIHTGNQVFIRKLTIL